MSDQHSTHEDVTLEPIVDAVGATTGEDAGVLGATAEAAVTNADTNTNSKSKSPKKKTRALSNADPSIVPVSAPVSIPVSLAAAADDPHSFAETEKCNNTKNKNSKENKENKGTKKNMQSQKQHTNHKDMEDDESGGTDAEDAEDAKEARCENKDPEIVAEKTRYLAKIAEWAEREVAMLEAKAVARGNTKPKKSKKSVKSKPLTVDTLFDTIFDEYERLKEVLGELDSDDEEGVVDDEEAEEEIEETEEAAHARMLAELETWYKSGTLKRPRRDLSKASYEDVELAYDKARDKLGLSGVEDVQDEAAAFIAREQEVRARKAASTAMLAKLDAWYRSGRARKPARGVSALSSYDAIADEYERLCGKLDEEPTLLAGTESESVAAVVPAVAPPVVVGGRTLRNRDAIKPSEDPYTRSMQEACAEDDAREEKKALLKELRAWKKDGLYDDAAEGAVDLKTLSKPKTTLEEVQDEHDRVRLALGFITQEALEAERAGEVEDSDEEEGEEDDTQEKERPHTEKQKKTRAKHGNEDEDEDGNEDENEDEDNEDEDDEDDEDDEEDEFVAESSGSGSESESDSTSSASSESSCTDSDDSDVEKEKETRETKETKAGKRPRTATAEDVSASVSASESVSEAASATKSGLKKARRALAHVVLSDGEDE